MVEGPFTTGSSPQGRIGPAEYARAIPKPPLLSNIEKPWLGLRIQHFDCLPEVLDLPAGRDHRLTLQLAGYTLIERLNTEHGDRRWSGPGSTNLVPAGRPVTRRFRGHADFMVMHLEPTLITDIAFEAFGAKADLVCLPETLAMPDPTVEQVGNLLLLEARDYPGGSQLFADTMSQYLALHLIRTYSPQSWPQAQKSELISDRRMRAVVEYMHANLVEDITLARLATIANLSPFHFARSFRTIMGEAPHRYLVHLRIERARRLLVQTDLPITEVGLSCGFNQAQRFSNAFRRATGLSPRTYRTENKT